MVEKFINERVKGIKPYVAGATKEEVARKHGLNTEDVIKLASNENPYGPSPRVVEVIKNNATEIHRYPEDYPHDLIQAISKYIRVSEETIIVGGNGADEVMDVIIKTVVSKGDEVMVHSPSFPYYELLTRLYGGNVVKMSMDEDYSFPIDDILGHINDKTKLVIVCSPNNPTGSVISESGMRRILDTSVLVMLDEAYVEFADVSLTSLVNEYENLVVLRTFSKAFGLAGLRVGYGVASEQLIQQAMKIKPPHNVNLLAQKAAAAALDDLAYMEKTVTKIKKAREATFKELSQISGVKVHPSQANFLLISLIHKDPDEVILELEKRGIIVRGCRGFGLEDCIRVTIGTEEENQKFLSAFKEVLG
jgi:histidinol-phosphate aminotransferase